MRIAVCDDDQMEQEQFIQALHGWDPTRSAERFFDGASLLEAAKQPPLFDIIFLDIYMPGESGIDIARVLRTISPETGIVFVTTSKDHAVDAFSLYALHYLVKPVTAEGIKDAFGRLTSLRYKKRPMINFAMGRESHTVYLDEIYYLQSANHALEVFLINGRIMKIWMSLSAMEDKLDGNFLKINRGTIVNMEYIEQIGIDSCILRNGTRLAITRRDHIAIRASYDNYIFTRLSERKDFETEVRP